MVDLLASQAGLETLNRVACYLGRRRMSRKMKRLFYIAFKDWEQTGHFDKSTLLDSVNALDQDEIESLNTLLGQLGCLESTLAPMTIYVDPVNGDDVTGDGSSSYPYASMDFLKNLPRYINHNVRIILLNDLDMGTDALNLNFSMCDSGCLSIIGQSAPTTITTSAGAGPFTVTGVTSYGAAFLSDYGHYIQFADTWGVDELYGKWLKFETGNNAGEAYPIHANTANEISIRGGIEAAINIGDTVSVIEPAITLGCQTINIENVGPQNVFLNTEDVSRFNFLNLKIDLSGTYNESNNMVLKSSIETQISFCTIISTVSLADAFVVESNLNRYPSADIDIATYAQASIDNIDGPANNGTPCGIQMYNSDFLPPITTVNSIVIKGESEARCIDTRGMMYINGSNCVMKFCCAGVLTGYEVPFCHFYRSMVDAAGGTDSIILRYCGVWRIGRIVFTSAGVNVFRLSTVTLIVEPANISLVAAYAGHGFYYEFTGISKVHTTTSPAAITGAVGDIHFAGGVGVTAYPIADAEVTDSLESAFAYISTP